MALHRDILWIGKQWAVTGHGMQLIDQRLMGAFDIEVARLWDDDLIERMHAKEWMNVADFDRGLAVARTRHKPPDASAPSLPVESEQQASPELQMKIDGGARFARPWRVWMKKT
ncbi:hypothetical protein V1273_003880 [Bradyrhizobium sp. AZCC 1721]